MDFVRFALELLFSCKCPLLALEPTTLQIQRWLVQAGGISRLQTVYDRAFPLDAKYERWYMLAQLTLDSPSLATEWLPHYRRYIPHDPWAS